MTQVSPSHQFFDWPVYSPVHYSWENSIGKKLVRARQVAVTCCVSEHNSYSHCLCTICQVFHPAAWNLHQFWPCHLPQSRTQSLAAEQPMFLLTAAAHQLPPVVHKTLSTVLKSYCTVGWSKNPNLIKVSLHNTCFILLLTTNVSANFYGYWLLFKGRSSWG